MAATSNSSMNGPRKAAILMVLLGDDLAASVYKGLPESVVRAITQEIAELEYVTPQTASQVLVEYYRLTAKDALLGQGGEEYARRLLTRAFGEEGARGVLTELQREREVSSQDLDALQKTEPQLLANFIQGEHPQTIALVLAHLNTRVARGVLMLLPEKIRGQAVKRLAEMQQCSPEMMKTVSMVLHKRLLSLGQQKRHAYGGVKAVADLLNHIDADSTRTILESVEQDDVQLATSIRNLMFTFEDFLEVADVGLRELLGQIDKKMLATALKGTSEDLRNHFFKCMSTRAAEIMKEDMESLGPLRSGDVHAAQQEVVGAARRLEGEGKMVLHSEPGESYAV
jgi:flagellar motor switch protein FliG